MITRSIPLLTLLCVVTATVSAQNPASGGDASRPVSGRITNEKGDPIADVTVTIKGSQKASVSGADGRYSIIVPNAQTVLTFTHIAYASFERAVGEDRTVNVSLKDNAASLGDVVVVAYGRQKAATVTGSVSAISAKDLTSAPVSNVSNMLVGRASGLSGLQTSGEPGRNGANIFIRGVSTFAGTSNPLVVIDGVEQASERGYDQLNSMDANEIENISVLKDASATAVYGIRGANGVIIVTTRRGRASRPSLSLSANFGITQATNLLHNVNSYQYAIMRNEAINTEASAFGNMAFSNNLFTETDLWKLQNNRDYTPQEVDAMDQLTEAQKTQLKASPALYYGSRDLFAEQFGGTGPQKQLNLNISGGTSKIKYFTSLGYFSQGSILENTSYHGANTKSTFDRYNFRSNFDIDVIKNLSIAVNVMGQFGEVSGPGFGGGSNNPYDLNARYKAIMQYIFDSSPLTAPGLVDGKLVNAYLGVSGTPSNPLGITLGSLKGAQNALFNLLTSGTETLNNTLLSGSATFKYNLGAITKGLSLRGTVNIDDNYVKATAYQPSLPVYQVRRSPVDPNNFEFAGGNIGANVYHADPGHNSTWNKTYYDVGIDYANKFGDHSFSGLVLGKAQRYNVPTADNFFTPSGIMGLLGRITYNYKERYLAEFNAGYNGTEQFIEGRRFGFFPAYSAGWVISNESFFPENEWVSYVKIRGSYGEVGNDQLGTSRRYLYLPNTFNLGQAGYWFGTSDGSVTNPLYSGAAEGNLGNPAVTWERAKKKNIGFEARFFTGRLSLTIDYFKDERDGILTNLSDIIPYAYGVGSSAVPPANVGKTTNQGYELVLGWNDHIGELSYTVGANLNYAKNKIVYRAEAVKAHSWMQQTGYPIGQKYGLQTEGFFNTQDELDNSPYNTFNANKKTLGDVRYKDLDGDGLIDNRDIGPIGYSNLPQYSFNFKTGLSYKGFDLNVLFTGTARGSFNLAGYQFVNSPFYQTAGNVMQWQFDGRWTPEKLSGGEKVLYPRATMNGGAGSNANFLASDLWLISTDYLRLKNVEIGYRFQQLGFLKKAGISSVRLFANGNNLATLKSDLLKYGVDPETTDGGGYAMYPITRAYVFGLNIQF